MYASTEIRKLKWKNQEIENFYISNTGKLYFQNYYCQTFKINGRNYAWIPLDNHDFAKRIDYMVAYTYLGCFDDAVRLIHINEQIDDDRVENLMWYRKCDIIQEYKDKAIIEQDESIIEQWKPVTLEYNSYLKYEVSNFGKVRNQVTGELVKTYNSHGYEVFYYIEETKAKQTRSKCVHDLVAQAFLPNPNHYEFINHIDGNKLNNIVSNLEWVDRSMNVEHAYLQNLNRRQKYSSDQIHAVCDFLAHRKISHVQISYMTGVDRKTISDIYIGRRWKDISSQYVFQPKKWTPEIKSKMKELILQRFVVNEICKIMNLKYEQATISLYERLRRELRNEGKL